MCSLFFHVVLAFYNLCVIFWVFHGFSFKNESVLFLCLKSLCSILIGTQYVFCLKFNVLVNFFLTHKEKINIFYSQKNLQVQ